MSVTKIEENGLYDVEGLAKLLNITEKTVRKMVLEGEIKGRKLGRKWYVTGSALKAHFEKPDAPADVDVRASDTTVLQK